VLVSRLLDEPASLVVDVFLKDITDRPLVSDFAVAEVSSAVSRLVRMKAMSADDASRRLRSFDAWVAARTLGVEVAPGDVRVATSFVRRFELKLLSPDALHLACCLRLGAELACLDRRLSTAAAALDIPAKLIG
jgi:predicted nucleic acid-binding protein